MLPLAADMHRFTTGSTPSKPAPGAHSAGYNRRRIMKLLRRGGIGLVFLLGLLARIGPVVAEDMTTAIQTSRMTVREINTDARRIVCVNSQGRVHAHKVTKEAVVITGDKKTTDLASLNTGDVIKAELRGGQIQKIVVLRHAWHEAAGMEQ
jgi:hypothetical protein